MGLEGNAEGLKHGLITDQILKTFYSVYNELGHGFLESVYRKAMVLALREAGLTVGEEVSINVRFRGVLVGEFRADLIVDNEVIVELKCCSRLESAHEAQLLNYLRATEMEVGLLLNFGTRPQMRRLVFDNSRKQAPAVAADHVTTL